MSAAEVEVADPPSPRAARACGARSTPSSARAPCPRVCVADNGSGDGSREMLAAEHPSVRVLELGENRGFGAAVNAAARVERGAPDLILLNNDAEADERFCEELAAAAARSGAAAVAGCPAAAGRDDRQRRGRGGPLARRLRPPARRALPAARPAPATRSAPAAGRRRSTARRFLALGGFDEGFFAYLEDLDLAIRMRLAGIGCVPRPRRSPGIVTPARSGPAAPRRTGCSARDGAACSGSTGPGSDAVRSGCAASRSTASPTPASSCSTATPPRCAGGSSERRAHRGERRPAAPADLDRAAAAGGRSALESLRRRWSRGRRYRGGVAMSAPPASTSSSSPAIPASSPCAAPSRCSPPAQAGEARIACTVVDNASTRRHRRGARGAPARGPGAPQRGERAATAPPATRASRGGSAEIVLILNSDIYARPGAIGRLAEVPRRRGSRPRRGGRPPRRPGDRVRPGRAQRPRLPAPRPRRRRRCSGSSAPGRRIRSRAAISAYDLDYDRTQDVDQPAGSCFAAMPRRLRCARRLRRGLLLLVRGRRPRPQAARPRPHRVRPRRDLRARRRRHLRPVGPPRADPQLVPRPLPLLRPPPAAPRGGGAEGARGGAVGVVRGVVNWPRDRERARACFRVAGMAVRGLDEVAAKGRKTAGL